MRMHFAHWQSVAHIPKLAHAYAQEPTTHHHCLWATAGWARRFLKTEGLPATANLPPLMRDDYESSGPLFPFFLFPPPGDLCTHGFMHSANENSHLKVCMCVATGRRRSRAHPPFASRTHSARQFPPSSPLAAPHVSFRVG